MMFRSSSKGSTWRHFAAPDLLVFAASGTTLFSVRSKGSGNMGMSPIVGFLDEDDIAVVIEHSGDFVKVVTRLGVGWVNEDKLTEMVTLHDESDS